MTNQEGTSPGADQANGNVMRIGGLRGARQSSQGSRAVYILLLIIAIAFAARLSVTLWTKPAPPFLSDAEYYHAAASNIASGNGYSVHFDGDAGFGPGGEKTAFWPPGYSLVLGIAYTALGSNPFVGSIVNVVAGSLLAIPVYLVGCRLFDRPTGLTAAGITAAFPSLVLWTPVLLSETVFTLLFASAFASLLCTTGPNARLKWLPTLVTGALLGAATLTRGQALVLLGLAPVWWMLTGVKARSAILGLLLLSVIVTLALAPWAIRNRLVMDSPILLSANFGYNLRIGHADYTTGRYLVPQDLWDAKPGITFHEREVVFNNYGRTRALEYALKHPKEEAGHSIRKIYWLWRPDSDVMDWVSEYGQNRLPPRTEPVLRRLVDLSYFAALVGAAFTLLHGRRSAVAILTLSSLAAWTAIHVVFFGEPRYHLPMLIIIIPLFAASLVEFTRVSSLRWRPRPGRSL